MARHPEVKCVASLMGSGYFSTLSQTLFPPKAQDVDAVLASLADWDVTHALPRLADRPLLLWHGEADDIVPAAETLRLQQALVREGLDNNLTCLWEAGVRHRITPTALDATTDFFRKNL
ncbi:esterase [compost metagenome]